MLLLHCSLCSKNSQFCWRIRINSREIDAIQYKIKCYVITNGEGKFYKMGREHFFLLVIFIFSIIVGIQCSVDFYCTAKWPSHTYICIILFLILSSIMFHHKWLDRVPCAVQQDLIAYPLQCNSLHLLTPDSQSTPLPPPRRHFKNELSWGLRK